MREPCVASSFRCCSPSRSLSAGCGARLTDEQLATAAATGGQRRDGRRRPARPVRGRAGRRPAAAPRPLARPAAPRPAPPPERHRRRGAATGGDAGTGGGGEAAAACTPGSRPTRVGVTDTEIRIGNISTISGPVAGFGQTGVNAVKAYVNYVNANGGVCGRKLTLVTADDRLDTGTNRSETERLAGQVIGFVGGTTVVDDGGAAVLDGQPTSPTSALAIGSAAGSPAEQLLAQPDRPRPAAATARIRDRSATSPARA